MVNSSQKEILVNNTDEPASSPEQRPSIIKHDPVSRALAGTALVIALVVGGVDIYTRGHSEQQQIDRLQKDLERMKLEHKLETTLLLGEICSYEETIQQFTNSPDYAGTKKRCVEYQADWIETIKKQELPHP